MYIKVLKFEFPKLVILRKFERSHNQFVHGVSNIEQTNHKLI